MWPQVPSLHILRDSGTSPSALALLFVMQVRFALSSSFGLASGAAGGVSSLPAAGTGQNQLRAELGGTELVLVPGTVAVAAAWTQLFPRH